MARVAQWLDDPESSVEYAEKVEGRWAVRMRQQVRDATTVWFTVLERSLEYEAYVIPVPSNAFEVMRQALVRNQRAWRAFFAIDAEGNLLLRGRLPADRVTLLELDHVLGEIYETIELSFRPMVGAITASRETSG
ncbi:MAG: YbjN domain-containing protein [Acidimicrobiia bacterium]